MAFDVFIGYPPENKAVADAACAKLEAEGIRCWMAPRDLVPGADRVDAVIAAIQQCRLMLLIFSKHANGSREIQREVRLALDREKPVVPFRIENVNPDGTLAYYMTSVHWLDALTPPLEQHLQTLVNSIRRLLGRDDIGQKPRLTVAAAKPEPPRRPPPQPAPAPKPANAVPAAPRPANAVPEAPANAKPPSTVAMIAALPIYFLGVMLLPAAAIGWLILEGLKLSHIELSNAAGWGVLLVVWLILSGGFAIVCSIFWASQRK